MALQWLVDKNTGDRALLSSRFDRKEVFRPKTMSVAEFCELLEPGTVVLEEVLQILDKW
jgi:hypothetical protein